MSGTKQTMSVKNRRLELESRQVTGDADGAGVYARLLADRDLKATVDVRYFGFNEKRNRYYETRIGLIFDMVQLDGLLAAVEALKAEAARRGLK